MAENCVSSGKPSKRGKKDMGKQQREKMVQQSVLKNGGNITFQKQDGGIKPRGTETKLMASALFLDENAGEKVAATPGHEHCRMGSLHKCQHFGPRVGNPLQFLSV